MNKIISFFLLAAFTYSSCETTKNIFGNKVKETTVEELNTKVLEKHIVYKTFSAKANIDLTGPDLSQSVNAQIDILKDSVIGISLRVMGIEGARVMITPDSIKILDRLNQQYIPRSFSFIETNFSLPITYSDLENLICGNPVFYNNTTLTQGVSDDKYVLFAQKGVYKNTIWLSSEVDILRMFIEDLMNKRTLTLTYAEFDKIEGRQFAFLRTILIDATDDFTANIAFSKITFDQPFEFTFNVNPKYERID
ncbi:MAG: DUF4292 domain-containing protein [Bacteroidetes bacterium]|nr:DUF4292 domain-containing protein [Bacteroidota bacterium]